MLVTMRCNADAPVSWVPAPSFHMEHAVTLLSIGQHEWPEDTNPRTDAPVRFAVVRWPSRDGARMDRLTCIRPQWSRPVNRHPVRFRA